MARHVVAVVSDLFFVTKIAATAEAAGVSLETLDVPAARARLLGPGGSAPDLVLLDLAAGEPLLALARDLRAASPGAPPLAGFYSHVDHATRDAAVAAGVDPVLPRSVFVARLPALLRGEPAGGA